jgi:hypothetical protein
VHDVLVFPFPQHDAVWECHRALQNQPLMGASKPAMTLGGFSSTV